MSQSRHYVFTTFKDEVSFFNDPSIDYIIFGNEKCPKTGNWHKQGYVVFTKIKRLTALKKLDSSAHWEIKRGTPTEARQYCMKDGDFYERGDIPVESGDVYKHTLQLAEKGNVDVIKEKYPAMYLRYKRTIEGMRKYDSNDLDEPCGYWIYGRPGTGKDTTVLKLKPYVKSHNKWWDGYNNEECVVFQDLDDSHVKWIGSFLKTWSDRYAFNAETKGGMIKIRPKRFYVTSNYQLSDLFQGIILDALDRRFHKIDFDNDCVVKRPIIIVNDKLDLINF